MESGMGFKMRGDQGGRHREKPQGAIGAQKSFREEDKMNNIFSQRDKKYLKTCVREIKWLNTGY